MENKPMDAVKRKRLEAKGWKSVTVAEFLELTPEENAIIELRLVLSRALKDCRSKAQLTQIDFAKKLHTSQSRLAKMEAGDKSVSLDLLINNLLAVGVDRKGLAEIIASSV